MSVLGGKEEEEEEEESYALKPVPPAPRTIQPVLNLTLEKIDTAAEYIYIFFYCWLVALGPS